MVTALRSRAMGRVLQLVRQHAGLSQTAIGSLIGMSQGKVSGIMAGNRLGHEGNHMWTAFGPNNVLCHRVNAAIRLGDAGTAIDYARRVYLDALPINERKAALLLDATRAFLMWSKHEQALHMIRAAEQIAPEEITRRPNTRRLVGDLVATAPISIRREAREFADSLGIAA